VAKKKKKKVSRKVAKKPTYTSDERDIEKLIEHEQYSQAYVRIESLEAAGSLSQRLKELKGLALARWGRIDEAIDVLEPLYKKGIDDPETLGIYARTCMDVYDKTGEKGLLLRSRDVYAQAFKKNPEDYYTGINAAAKSVFLDELTVAKKYAEKVASLVGDKPTKGDYWATATSAEVQLLLQNYDVAAVLYHAAVQQAPDSIGSHSSTWLQAKRLMKSMASDPANREKIEAPFVHITRADAKPSQSAAEPAVRRLRVFAIDPSASRRTETVGINEVTLRVPWESAAPEPLNDGPDTEANTTGFGPGPVGEYLEVIDYDPASDCFYDPVNLNDPRLLATDGLPPSEGDPRFHQQMVYAVAMKVIDHFEQALGRRALWASRVKHNSDGTEADPEYVPRLRMYPHALREANAYYSPSRKALLFGYFPAESDDPQILPGGLIFTCLSHDVIAHEMSHALLDGLHPHFTEPTNPDVLAFHEAFADIVALFQHFSHADVLRREIARTRGNLATENTLGQLAQEFGRSIGRYGSLRDAIGKVDSKTGTWKPLEPDPSALMTTLEPHARGAILVAAVFDAFLTIYKARTEDLVRIATQGSGVLAPGALHPDLVARLAKEAGKTANHILGICIRALDYCPPVDIRFGDFLRAIITADLDAVRDDRLHYRVALIEAFQRRGIYPDDVRTLSEQSLAWRPPRQHNGVDLSALFEGLPTGKRLAPEWRPTKNRRVLWEQMRNNSSAVIEWFRRFTKPSVAEEIGLSISADSPNGIFREGKLPAVEVHSVRLARRTTPDGEPLTDIVVELLQKRRGYFDLDRQRAVDRGNGKPGDDFDFIFRGGCTLLVDPSTYKVRYAINKHILSEGPGRLDQQRDFLQGEGTDLRATYFGDPARESTAREFFGLLHQPDEAPHQ